MQPKAEMKNGRVLKLATSLASKLARSVSEGVYTLPRLRFGLIWSF